ncbi:MAG: sigma-70 family RNA polymerase sigma factor [Burkholderiaceae bacterium]|nr:sigma-70 family RNA polymerase sigma factor [Burkholderiaceae bacterium]
MPTVDPALARPDAAITSSDLATLRQRLLRHARYAVSDHSVAEDLVQDTLIDVLEGVAGRRGDASLITWATAILRHKVADWYRAPARRVMVQLTQEDDWLRDDLEAQFDDHGRWREPVPAWQQPEQHEERRQMMGKLEGCMSQLPAQTGRVFVMREWLGFDTGEIAERLGLSADNIRQILHRARMGLRGCMQHQWVHAGRRP